MTRNDMQRILHEFWGARSKETTMIDSVLLSDTPPNITADRLIWYAKNLVLRHKPAWRLDRDEYWLGQNPFDGRWHLFISRSEQSEWPEKPTSISEHFPLSFDDEMD